VLSAFDNMFRVLFDDTPLETPSPYITRIAYLSFVLKHPTETTQHLSARFQNNFRRPLSNV
jgi:hypothetical protein